MDSPVRAAPIWLSRQACTKAAIATGSREELETFLTRRVAPTVRQLCDALGLLPQDYPDLRRRADVRLDTPGLRSELLDFLTETHEVRSQIVLNAAASRSRLIDYLASITEQATTVVLVDLGWGGTIQERLNATLSMSGSPVSTVGLYLLTAWAAVDRTLDGLVAEGFLASLGLPESIARWVARSPEILEQMCTSDDGSLLDFSSEGAPVTAPNTMPVVQSLQRIALQSGVVAFQDEWLRYRKHLPDQARRPDPYVMKQLQRIVSRFILSPTPEEAAMFGRWLHDENGGSDDSETVIADHIAASIGYMSPQELVDLPISATYWPFGAAVLHNPPLGLAAAAIANGDISANAFVGGESVSVRIAVDRGHGWDVLAWEDIRPSMGSRYTFRTSITSGPVRAVALDCGREPGIIRLSWLGLRIALTDDDPVELRFDTPASLKDLTLGNCLDLGNNLLLGDRQGPRLSWRCPPGWSERVARVDLELAFEWLRGGPVTAASISAQALGLLKRRAAAITRTIWDPARKEAHGRRSHRH
jgi:hypothetical protein